MRDVIDAEFEVIEGPAKARPDPRWVFYWIRMALGLVAIGAVLLASLESPKSAPIGSGFHARQTSKPAG